MKILLMSVLAFLTTACVTGVKVQDQGPVNLKAMDTNGAPLAPLVLQYKIDIPVTEYEILILDENKKRYQIKMNTATNTENGVVLYLPAGRSYALNKFVYIRDKAPRQQELLFGGETNFFRLDSGVVTYIGYFEMSEQSGDSSFRIHKPNVKDRETRLKDAMKYLSFSEPINRVEKYSSY